MGMLAADGLFETALDMGLLTSADGMFFLKLKDNNLNYMARLHWEGAASCPPIKKCPNL